MKILYSTLIHPYLSYGIEAWHSTFKNLTNKIFILQKKAIRAVNSLDYNDHTNQYYSSDEILKLEDQFNLQISSYIFQILKSDIDKNMLSKIMELQEAHPHHTRHSEILKIPIINRSMSKNNIIFKGIKIWNSLPKSIKNVNSLNKFKRDTKTWYLIKY